MEESRGRLPTLYSPRTKEGKKIKITFSKKRIDYNLNHILTTCLTAQVSIFKKRFLKISIGPI
jgi:hypothetical protein